MPADAPAPDPLDYTLWATLRRSPPRPAGSGEVAPALAEVGSGGLTVRGFYDVSSIRADADHTVWLHGPAPERQQAALRRGAPLVELHATWRVLGVHREAKFNAAHQTAFLRGLPAQRWLTVHPFVRPHQRYLLAVDDRRAMPAEHGRKGAIHRSVRSSTVPVFGFGDDEWMLVLEAPELIDPLGLVPHPGKSDARRHVSEETPCYT